MWIIVILVYSVLIIYDFVPLYKQKLWHDFWVNAALGLVSFIIAIMLCFDIKPPSPEGPIKDMITSMFGK